MHAEFKKYRLKFRSPVKFFGQTLAERSGFLLRISHENRIVEGEIPFFPTMPQNEIERNIATIKDYLSKENLNLPVPPRLSVPFAFGLSSCLLALRSDADLDFSRVKSYPFYQSISDCTSKDSFPKVKFSGTASEISAINSAEGEKFRLDFNRRLNFDEACKLLTKIDLNNILYIEEPISDIKLLPKLKRRFDFSLALDETVINRELTSEMLNLADYLIIKPALIGDFDYIAQLAASGKQIVFSSAYESKIGTDAIRRLICMHRLERSPHGLDTEKYIEKFEVEP